MVQAGFTWLLLNSLYNDVYDYLICILKPLILGSFQPHLLPKEWEDTWMKLFLLLDDTMISFIFLVLNISLEEWVVLLEFLKRDLF